MCRLKVDDFEGAVSDATKALEIAPNGPKALYIRCAAYKSLGKVEDAYRDAAMWIEVDPKNPSGKQILKLLTQIIRQKMTTLKGEGNEKFKNGDFDGALSCYTQALEISEIKETEQAVIFKSRALCRLKLDDFEGALSDATKALEIVPKDRQALCRRCTANASLGKFEDANTDAAVLKKVAPKNRSVKQILNRLTLIIRHKMTTLKEEGYEKFKNGDFDGALSCYTQSLEISEIRETEQAVNFKNRALCRLKLDDFEGAVSDATKALEIVPKDRKALYRRFTANASLGKFEDAYTDAAMLIKVAPKNRSVKQILNRLTLIIRQKLSSATTLNEKGIEKLNNGDFDGAMSCFTHALEISEIKETETEAIIFMNISMCRLIVNDFEGAVSEVTKALEFAPNDPKALYIRCTAYAILGKVKDAHRDATMLIKVVPNNQLVKSTLERLTLIFKQKISSATTLKEEGNEKFKNGDFDGPMSCFTQALENSEIKETEIETVIFMNRAMCRSEVYDFDGAVSDATKALEIAPNDPETLQIRFMASGSMGKSEDAYRNAAMLINVDPSVKEILNLLTQIIRIKMSPKNTLKEIGNEKFKNGDFDGALYFYTRALEIREIKETEKADIFKNRAMCRLKLDDFEGAVADAAKALEIAPNDQNTLYIRYTAYRRLGKVKDACSDAAMVIEIEHLETQSASLETSSAQNLEVLQECLKTSIKDEPLSSDSDDSEDGKKKEEKKRKKTQEGKKEEMGGYALPKPFSRKGPVGRVLHDNIWKRWEQSIDDSNLDGILSLLKTGDLPDNDLFGQLCDKEGLDSNIVKNVCDTIGRAMKTDSEQIVCVWSGYRPDNEERIVFVACTSVAIRYPKPFVVYPLNTFSVIFRGANDFSSEAKDVLYSRESMDKMFTQRERQNIRICIQQNSKQLMHEHSNLTMISASPVRSEGFGTEISAKKPDTCIVLYLHVKGVVPLSEKPFPKLLKDSRGEVEFPVDVREGGFDNLSGHKASEPHSNLRIGCQIGSDSNQNCKGTLGAFVNLPDGALGCITCAHVLLSDYQLNILRDQEMVELTDLQKVVDDNYIHVYQPAVRGDEVPIGHVCKAIFRVGGIGVTGVDVALVQMTDEQRHPITGCVPDGDHHHAGFTEEIKMHFSSGEASSCEPKDTEYEAGLLKFGCRSGITRGSFHLHGSSIRRLTHSGQQMNFGFELHDQIECLSTGSAFAKHGDSGALVFIAKGGDHQKLKAVGIVEGGTTMGTVLLTPIWEVLDALGLRNKFKVFQHGSIFDRQSNAESTVEATAQCSPPRVCPSSSSQAAVTVTPNNNNNNSNNNNSGLASLIANVSRIDSEVSELRQDFKKCSEKQDMKLQQILDLLHANPQK